MADRKAMKALKESLCWEPAQTVTITTVDEGLNSGYHIHSDLGDWWVMNGEGGYEITDTDPFEEGEYCGGICAESTAKKYMAFVEAMYAVREGTATEKQIRLVERWL